MRSLIQVVLALILAIASMVVGSYGLVGRATNK